MAAKKSKVWNYFAKKKNDNFATCNICKDMVAASGGTTNLSVHLLRHHKINLQHQIRPRDKNNNEPSCSTSKTIGGGDEPSSNTSKTVDGGDKESSSGRFVSTVNPWSIAEKSKLSSMKSNEITNAILAYIVHDLRPLNTIESPVFRNMIKAMEPRYQPPNRQRLSEQLIPALFETEKAKLFQELQSSQAVSLTTDAWTSRSAESYLTITCHFVNKDWEMCSRILQTDKFHGSHTGERVGYELKTCMTNWAIQNKVNVMTVDNASNMTVAIEVTGAQKLGCLAHTLNLVSNKAMSIQALQRVLAKVRSIVTHFHKSNIATEVLKEKQIALQLPQHKLIIDCKTRWNSNYHMIQRFLIQRPAVLAALLDERIKKSKALSGMTDHEVQICEDFVSVMDVMLTATLVLCEEKTPTSGLILPLLGKLLHHFERKEGDSDFILTLKNAVGQNLATRYTDNNVRMFLEESSASDPRTKGKPCIQAETWERLEDKLSVMDLNVNAIKADARPVRPVNIPQVNHIPLPALPTIPDHLRSGSSTEDDSDNEISKPSEQKVPRTALESLFGDDEVLVTSEEFITPAELARKEVERYKGHKPASMKENPLAWWKENEVYFPKLARLARTYFCVQATSVASERVFSTTGDIVSATRACLSPERVNELVFLKKNMKF